MNHEPPIDGLCKELEVAELFAASRGHQAGCIEFDGCVATAK